MPGKKWFQSKTLIFNATMVVLYGLLYVCHPDPSKLNAESLIAATTAVTNVFLRLLTDKPII